MGQDARATKITGEWGCQRMAEEDDGPLKRPARLQKLVLDPLGIEELKAYIGELREEIARAEAMIERKAHHRSAADGFFRKLP
jgi:uncharacterized small protein (DUF1192 family)